MQRTPAMLITETELNDMLTKAGKLAAQEIVEHLKQDIYQDPQVTLTKRLRAFIEDRSTELNPRDIYANGRHIRMVQPNKNGKPKSTAWFQNFKRDSTLNQCFHRPSPDHGHLQEWCFEDIANAWDHYHRQRYLKQAQ